MSETPGSVERFAAFLRKAGLQATAREIADAIWLATKMPPAFEPHAPEEDAKPKPADEPLTGPRDAEPENARPHTERTQKRERDAGMFLEGGAASKMGGAAFRGPGATALPSALALGRSLRPLKRRVASRVDFEVDEAATADRIAQGLHPSVEIRPARARWLDLALVVDDAGSMGMWRQTVMELRALLERLGAFRLITIHRLATDEGAKAQLFTGAPGGARRPTKPHELFDPLGRRLILVVSDCVAPAWDDGQVGKLLQAWGGRAPVAVLQVLPERLWQRTGLGAAEMVCLRASAPGTRNVHLNIERLSLGLAAEDERAEVFAVPVIELDERSAGLWARMLANGGEASAGGVLLPTRTMQDVTLPDDEKHPAEDIPAAEIVARFRSMSSPEARRLATLFAAAPLSLPVMRLIREVMLPQATLGHMAEVFLGGLMRELVEGEGTVEPEYVRYEFLDGVRERLLDSASGVEATGVLACVSEYVTTRLGSALDFRVWLADPTAMAGEAPLAAADQPFAAIGAAVLRRLGGAYAELGERLAQHVSVFIENRAAHLEAASSLPDGARRMSEIDMCAKYVVAQLCAAGWNEEPHSFAEQVTVIDGRAASTEIAPRQKTRKTVDFLLRHTSNFPIAVVEAKAANKTPSDGLEQAKTCAAMLGLHFAYSTNGRGIVEFDFLSRRETQLQTFPRPEELWLRIQAHEATPATALPLAGLAYEEVLLRPYQKAAVDIAMRAIVQEKKKRLLLTLATGTGKTIIAFHICWKLWNSKWNRMGEPRRPKILFLTHQVALVNQAMTVFAPLADACFKIERGRVNHRHDIYFATYQALAMGESNLRLTQELSRDMFDMVIVDDCQGAARENSTWRAVLEYFGSAHQLGMSAIPLRGDDFDHHEYFGTPIYQYSLGDGIKDGYLAPYRVIRVTLDIDEEGGSVDGQKHLVRAGDGNIKDFERQFSTLPRTRAIARHLTEFLRTTDRFAKTIVFCANQRHALAMLHELQLLNADLVQQLPEYVCRVASDDGPVGRRHLDRFMDVQSTTPVIVTTVQLLATGFDVPTCKNIVLARSISSMIEFKRIVGIGTRLQSDYGKTFFNILDYTGATRLFDSPGFDGQVTTIREVAADDEGKERSTSHNTQSEMSPADVAERSPERVSTSLLQPQHAHATLAGMPSAGALPIRLFVSYAPADRDLKDELLKHLSVLQRVGKVDVWSADRVRAGSDWREEVETALAEADMALLLVSADFLASDFLQDVEVPRLFERFEQKRLRLIPIVVRTCSWQHHPWIGKLKLLPATGKAIAANAGDARDQILTEIALEIANIASTALLHEIDPGSSPHAKDPGRPWILLKHEASLREQATGRSVEPVSYQFLATPISPLGSTKAALQDALERSVQTYDLHDFGRSARWPRPLLFGRPELARDGALTWRLAYEEAVNMRGEEILYAAAKPAVVAYERATFRDNDTVAVDFGMMAFDLCFFIRFALLAVANLSLPVTHEPYAIRVTASLAAPPRPLAAHFSHGIVPSGDGHAGTFRGGFIGGEPVDVVSSAVLDSRLIANAAKSMLDGIANEFALGPSALSRSRAAFLSIGVNSISRLINQLWPRGS